MIREEAIEVVKKNWPDSRYTLLREALETLIPELKESEDERMTRAINNILPFIPNEAYANNGVTKEDVLNWLEKQKYDRMQPIYDNRESFESALDKAWNDYHDGYENVDKLEDDYVECTYAKGFREGYLFGIEKQKEPENISASTMIPSFHEELTEFELVLFNAVLDNNFVGAKGSENALAMTKKVAPELLAIAKKEPDWDRKKCFVCQEYEKGFKQGHLEGCTAGYNKAMKEVDEQKEQKPDIEICPHSIKSKSYKENGYPIEDCDYGLEIALNILEKTLGKAQGYQTDDGIREHQTAIKAVKDVMDEQKPAEWSEKHIANVFEKVGLAKIVREQGNDALTNAVQSAMIELSKTKPAEWSEEDKQCLDEAIEILENLGYDGDADNLKRLRPQPKQEWSEEDEKIRKALVWHLKADVDFVSNGVTKAECLAYLDKQKVQKQEWGEEDKRILKGIIGLIDHDQHYGVGNKEMLAWLKSLRPSWKPSEEQIYSLGTVVKGAGENSVGSVAYNLKELYEQLKAIKEDKQ